MGNKASKDKQKLKPSAMDDLLQTTMFTEEEIKSWYKNFLKEFPDGQVTKEQFKDLYSKQFPSGDAKEFAEHVFRTFDKDSDHTLDFREFMTALSTTARGGPKERLKWAFHMYDIDQNGYISKDECTEIIKALYKLLSKHLPKKTIDKSPEERADNIFSLLDLNQDNCITIEEFLLGCHSDPELIKLVNTENCDETILAKLTHKD